MYILVIDDDPLNCELVKFLLLKERYEVEVVDNPRGAIHLIEKRLPDLLLLDIRMPGMDGFALTEHLEKTGYRIPRVYLTACSTEEDRLRGYKLGAEDYICKPYSPAELLERVKVVARHQRGVRPAQHLRVGPIELIPEELHLLIAGQSGPLPLTPTEARLLAILMSHEGIVVQRGEFIATIWNDSEDMGSNILDVFIKRLRGKLRIPGKMLPSILTVRGVGYKLVNVN